METLGPLKRVYRGYIGIIGYILGLYWDNGKENGYIGANGESNGKENGK